MKDTEATALLKKYNAGTCSKEEKARLESWYLTWNDEEQSFEENELIALRREMWEAMPKVAPKTVKLWTRFQFRPGMTGLITAAAVAAVVFGVWFSSTYQDASIKSGSTAGLNDIAPGKNGATITLADGKVIELSDSKTGVVVGNGRIAYSSPGETGTHDEIASIPRNDLMRMTASTAKGQMYQFTLPDGTKVWLNAASKLEFPSKFGSAKQRIVRLSGEGYFEVSKDKLHPFLVVTDRQEVEVLGTHFNINGYDDEGTVKTTLLEGSVRVSSLLSSGAVKDGVILKPDQQSVLTGNVIEVKQANLEEEMAWKNGYFMFESEEIGTIMRKIARWYNLEIEYGSAIPTDKFWGTVSRFSNVSQVLKKLELTGKVHFKIEGRRIIVSK